MSLRAYLPSIFFIIFLLFSCEPDSIAESESIEVVYKTICFCKPYGESMTTFNQFEIARKKISNTDSIPDVSCKISTPGGDWNRILQNLNIAEFIELPETIGCPNCTDEGARSLKIITQKSEHQVTWSNNEELHEMKVLLDIINELLIKHFQFTECQ